MMTRTPDDVKKGLECLIREEELDDTCGGCDYLLTHGPCAEHILPDALALIQQLQADNAKKDQRIQQLEAERDAAVRELEVVAEKVGQVDAYIDDYIHANVDYSTYLDARNMVDSIVNWEYESEWRGVQKEE